MELNEQIAALDGSIERLNRRIARLESKRTDQHSDPDLDANIAEHLRVRDQSLRDLRILKQRYNQRMLSKMVKDGIKDDETVAWWINRY